MSAVRSGRYVEAARREKRAALEAARRRGRSPIATSALTPPPEALAAYDDAMGEDGPEVRVAGRLAALRSQGKTMFAHLEDAIGRIQIYFRRDRLGDATSW